METEGESREKLLTGTYHTPAPWHLQIADSRSKGQNGVGISLYRAPYTAVIL